MITLRTKPRRPRGLNSAGLVMGVAVAALGLFTGCAKKVVARPVVSDVPVYVKKAEARQIPLFVEAIGSLEAYRSVTLMPQVSGLLRAVEFVDGAPVKKGQVLYRIEQDTYQQTLDKAAAALTVQRSALKPAEDRLRRSQELNQNKLLAPQDFEALQESAAQAKANLASAEADFAQAKLNLERTTIAAPMDGVIGINPQHVGNLLSAQQTQLVTLRQIEPIYATFSIPGPEVPAVLQARQTGKLAVQVTRADDFKAGPLITGELEVMDNTIDTRADMITLKGKLPNPDKSLWPGQFVRVRLILSEMPDTIVVDDGAVMIGTDGPYVYIVKGGQTVEMRKVVLGESDDGVVVVKSGIAAGEDVVIQGQLNLRNGTAVRVLPLPHAVASTK